MSRSICTALILSVAGWFFAAAPAPAPLPYALRDDAITFRYGATDADLAILDTLSNLKSISLGGGPGGGDGQDPRTIPWPITDTGFAHVASCKKLEYLGISGPHPLAVT